MAQFLRCGPAGLRVPAAQTVVLVQHWFQVNDLSLGVAGGGGLVGEAAGKAVVGAGDTVPDVVAALQVADALADAAQTLDGHLHPRGCLQRGGYVGPVEFGEDEGAARFADPHRVDDCTEVLTILDQQWLILRRQRLGHLWEVLLSVAAAGLIWVAGLVNGGEGLEVVGPPAGGGVSQPH